jgi:hypothetical protein
MVSTDKLLITGMHIGFPGVGHVAKAGTGYAFVMVPWSNTLWRQRRVSLRAARGGHSAFAPSDL